jgi:hypothetical protein
MEAIGHCKITAATGCLAAVYTTGKVPKLNPHNIISFIFFLSVNQANIISRSLHITS